MKKLTIALGDYPHTRPLRDGRVTSDQIELEFIDRDPISDAFDDMVRRQTFDVSEMAVGAFLQGRAASKPIVLLPVVVVGGFHHGRLRYWVDRGKFGPEELPGMTLAIRSYSQTTGLWVRGILEEQFGVDLSSLKWLTLEDSHTEEYVDPPNVHRARQGSNLLDLLRSGDAAAAALSNKGADGTATVIADVRAAEDEWYGMNQVVGINHMVCVRQDIADDPSITRELYRMLCTAHELVLGAQPERMMRRDIPSAIREGVEQVRPALEIAARFAHRQGMISTAPAIDALFPDYVVEAGTR